MNLLAFQNLTAADISSIVKSEGIDVCAFALNGTRRWFMLEHQLDGQEDKNNQYFDIITDRLIELCQMIYDHGISTLVMPIISPYLLNKRGDEYTRMVIQSLGELTFGEKYRQFYDDYGIRVRFYGDSNAFGESEINQQLSQQFAQVTWETAHHRQNRLFWGVCAHDATEQIAEHAVKFFQNHGYIPSKSQLIELYYGEAIAPVDLFISSSKPRAFDMPLISSGREELYFTVAPSPYLNEEAFRKILHDHIFNRKATHITYQKDSIDNWVGLRDFYRANRENTIGVGTHISDWGIWLPTSQVNLPDSIAVNHWLEDGKK